MDVTSGSSVDGALMEIWSYSGGTNQRFYLTLKVAVTNINPIEDNAKIDIFPNPTVDELNINRLGSIIEKVEVINSMGLKIISENFKSDNVILHIGGFLSGLYIVVIFAGQNRISRKIVKI